jgi:multicomponent Na+:H+ antiporter subunit F
MILFEPPLGFLAMTALFAMFAVVVAVVVGAVVVLRGPGLPERALALDLIGLLSVSFIAVVAVASEQAVLLDAALAVALVSFLGTVAFARFIEQRAKGPR